MHSYRINMLGWYFSPHPPDPRVYNNHPSLMWVQLKTTSIDYGEAHQPGVLFVPLTAGIPGEISSKGKYLFFNWLSEEAAVRLIFLRFCVFKVV